jgi:hypothetical protein
MVYSNSSTSSSFCEVELNETFLKCVPKFAARGRTSYAKHSECTIEAHHNSNHKPH